MQSSYIRIHGDRQQQIRALRAKGWQIVTYKAAPVVVAYRVEGKAIFARYWTGSADKPAMHSGVPNVYFLTPKALEDFMRGVVQSAKNAVTNRANRQAETKAKRAALKASDHWTEGDVLYNSWGYDQTNIDWYQVTAVKEKSIVVRRIMKNYGEKQHLAGYSQPRRNEFTSERMLKPLSEDGRVRFEHGAATKWDGKPVYESHYA